MESLVSHVWANQIYSIKWAMAGKQICGLFSEEGISTGQMPFLQPQVF